MNTNKYTEANTSDVEELNSHKNHFADEVEPVKKHRQFIAGNIANISSFVVGTCLGWTSPVLPKLADEELTDSPLNVVVKDNSEESAWISSLVAIGALVAPFIAGPLADKIGRKWTLISSTIFFLIAYVLLMIGGQVWVLYAGRLFQGFGVGFVMTAQPMYIGEISSDTYRGALGSLMQLYLVIGILYVYAIGPYVSYMTLQWCCILFPILFAVAFFFMPESPHQYLQTGERTKAKNSLKYLRGRNSISVYAEITEMELHLQEEVQNKGSFADLFKNKGNRKAVIICLGLMTFQQLSGINVVLFNAQTIFKDASTGLDPAIATILIGVVQVLSCGVTPLIVDRLGRKPILAVSAAVMAITLVMLGVFFYIKFIGEDISNIGWFPVTSLLIYMLVFCVGFGPLPWAILGEMFPANVKSSASSLVASFAWMLGFIVTRFYPALNSLGPHIAFFLFGGFCAIGFFFVIFVVMETKGMSLQQIQEKLKE